MLLCIDTSAGTSVAVVDRDAGVLAERNSNDTRHHAELIGEFIAECIHESGVAVSDLSGVAIGMGPGPFTGLRVGIAAARTFAFAIGCPVAPVVSHDAIAFGNGANLLVVSDARRHEVNWSAYGVPDEFGLPVREHGPALARPEALAATVPDFSRFRRLDSLVSAASVGMLAEQMFATGQPFAENVPVYLRTPDVTLAHAPKRVS